MSEVVIGEAVVLDVRPAGLPSRALAFAVDALIMVVLYVLVLLTMAIVGSDMDDALGAAVSIVLLVGVFVGYPLLWETLTRGRSPGKYAMGLRVVRDDGGPIVFRHALARSLAGLVIDFGLVSFFTGFIGVVTSLCSARAKRIGDLLAGTIVVRERVPYTGGRFAGLPPADPWLAQWATGCELSGLPDALALTGRQFLARAPTLAPAVRTSLAERLAGDVATHVAPPPPPGVPAEAYLAAVLGERRRRETMRLAGAAASARAGSGVTPARVAGPPSGAAPSAPVPPGHPPPSGPAPAPVAAGPPPASPWARDPAATGTEPSGLGAPSPSPGTAAPDDAFRPPG